MFKPFIVLSILISSPCIFADTPVIVEVPDNVYSGSSSTIGVYGTPNKVQASAFAAFKCQTNDEVAPLMGSCKPIYAFTDTKGKMSQSAELNRDWLAQPGYYMIAYSGGITNLLKVSLGQQLRIQLKEIHVPKKTGTFQYTAYFDTTNLTMKDRMLKFTYGRATSIPPKNSVHYNDSSSYGIGVNTICSSSVLPSVGTENPEYTKYLNLTNRFMEHYCKAWSSNNYKDIEGAELTDFAVNVPNYGAPVFFRNSYSLTNPQQIYFDATYVLNPTLTTPVIDPKDGESISVLPGVYSLMFTSPAMGAPSVLKNGIVVE